MNQVAETADEIPSAPTRKALIADAFVDATGSTHFVPAEDGYLELSEIILPNSALVYRIDNGRILSELANYAHHYGLQFADLKSRAETPDVQAVLHGLLIDKAQDPAGPIYNELEKHRRQTEPLLIQGDGTVLNGNRRLAAMRELLARDPKHYALFEKVRAALLPADLSQNELEFIEAALQMAPDLKLDYSWINRRLKLRQHVEDMEAEAIVAAYRFADSNEIDIELGELALVEDYLRWIDKPLQYGLIESQEEAFVLLNEQLQRQENKKLSQLWRLVGFAMIFSEESLDRPITQLYPFTDPVPPALPRWVLRTLAADRQLIEHQEAGENRALDKGLAARLRALIDDYRQAESTAGAVVALSDMLKGDESRLLGGTRILHHLRAARRILEAHSFSNISKDQMRQIRSEAAALYEGLSEPGEGFRPRNQTLRRALASLRKILRR